MLRRKVTKRRKAGSETTDAAESEGEPPAGPAPHLSPEGSTKSEIDPAKPDKPPRFRKSRPKRQIKASPCILSDATGLKVLVKGIPTAWDAYLDVFNVDKLAVYQFALTKHGDELANAHPRRAFRDAEAVQPTAAKEGGRFIAKMYEIERRALGEGLIGQPLRPDSSTIPTFPSTTTRASALFRTTPSCG